MFKIQFNTGNAAFDDGNDKTEIARILAVVLVRVEGGWISGPIRDINGNVIGSWLYEKKAEEGML